MTVLSCSVGTASQQVGQELPVLIQIVPEFLHCQYFQDMDLCVLCALVDQRPAKQERKTVTKHNRHEKALKHICIGHCSRVSGASINRDMINRQ